MFPWQAYSGGKVKTTITTSSVLGCRRRRVGGLAWDGRREAVTVVNAFIGLLRSSQKWRIGDQ